MIVSNNKELATKFRINNDNEKECQSIIKIIDNQEKEIWSNYQAIDLGTSKTFNIQELLPDVDYTQLTTDNFMIVSSTFTGISNTIWDYSGLSASFSTSKSYNANTGVLNCSLSGRAGGYTGSGGCRVYYVKKPSKLIDLGTNKSVDIKNIYRKWSDLTADNFVVPTIVGTSCSANFQASVGWSKGYSNGVISFRSTWYTRDPQGSGSSANHIYLVKNVRPL